MAKARRDEFGNALDVLDAQERLAGRPEDRDLVGLLRHVLAGMEAVRVADEDQEGRAGVQRLHEPP